MMGSVLDGMDMDAVIDEFDRTVREDLDFGAEARNLQRLLQGLLGFGGGVESTHGFLLGS